eukprot:14644087-Alexandrium_andersonii.AAC.1
MSASLVGSEMCIRDRSPSCASGVTRSSTRAVGAGCCRTSTSSPSSRSPGPAMRASSWPLLWKGPWPRRQRNPHPRVSLRPR